MIDHELWMHKSHAVMCEFFFKKDVPMRRTLEFSYVSIDGRTVNSGEDFFLGARYYTATPNHILLFPDDFIKIGDV